MHDVERSLILKPRKIWWEALGVFNPGVIEWHGQIYMLYRAVGLDHVSRFGLAISDDGEVFRQFDEPVFEPEEGSKLERQGVEDPRLVALDGTVYLTYTAASAYPAGPQRTALNAASELPRVPWRLRAMVARTKDFRHFQRLGVMIPDLDTKDAVLFPTKTGRTYGLLHRINPAIYFSQSSRLDRFSGGIQILAPQESWEIYKIGTACPPIKTKEGWLLLYHGVSQERQYALGAALLAEHNPALVLGRTKLPLLRPRTSWEKSGSVDNVVFVSGVLHRGEMLWLYYGGADRVVGLAKLNLSDILAQIKH